jgi:hypothetical protein
MGLTSKLNIVNMKSFCNTISCELKQNTHIQKNKINEIKMKLSKQFNNSLSLSFQVILFIFVDCEC